MSERKKQENLERKEALQRIREKQEREFELAKLKIHNSLIGRHFGDFLDSPDLGGLCNVVLWLFLFICLLGISWGVAVGIWESFIRGAQWLM